jgi:hypothetical protein
MLKPHNHTEPDADLVTIHASWFWGRLSAHLEHEHGFSTAGMSSERLRQIHAEEHAIALSPEDQGIVSEAEKRGYAGALLRRLAKDHLGELDHTHLPWEGQEISIVATDEVQSWLYGVATRVENGADL